MKLSEIEINPIKITLIIIVGLIAWYLGNYINSMLTAIIIYVLCRPLLMYLIDIRKWKSIWASLSIMLLTFVLFLLPLTLIGILLSSKINYVVHNYTSFLDVINQKVQLFLDQKNIDIQTGDILQRAASYIGKYAPDAINATASTVAQLSIMYFTLFYMLKENKNFEKWLLQFSPFSKVKTHLLLEEFNITIKSNSIGIPVIATVQAIVALIGYAIFGVDEPFLWAVLTGLFSVIPIVGTMIIWLPLSLYLVINGDPIQGSGLLLYSMIIITNIDNVVRFLLLKKLGDVHPLITVFGVILGLQLFGFMGIILGPLVLSYLFMLIKFYRLENVTDDDA